MLAERRSAEPMVSIAPIFSHFFVSFYLMLFINCFTLLNDRGGRMNQWARGRSYVVSALQAKRIRSTQPKRMKRNVFNRRIKCAICAEPMPCRTGRTVPIAKALLLSLARARIIRTQLSINYNCFCFRPAHNPFAFRCDTLWTHTKNANERTVLTESAQVSDTCQISMLLSLRIFRVFGYHLGVPWCTLYTPMFSVLASIKDSKMEIHGIRKVFFFETIQSIGEDGQWTPESGLLRMSTDWVLQPHQFERIRDAAAKLVKTFASLQHWRHGNPIGKTTISRVMSLDATRNTKKMKYRRRWSCRRIDSTSNTTIHRTIWLDQAQIQPPQPLLHSTLSRWVSRRRERDPRNNHPEKAKIYKKIARNKIVLCSNQRIIKVSSPSAAFAYFIHKREIEREGKTTKFLFSFARRYRRCWCCCCCRRRSRRRRCWSR